MRDAVNPAHTIHGVDSAKTSYLKDRSRDGNVLVLLLVPAADGMHRLVKVRAAVVAPM